MAEQKVMALQDAEKVLGVGSEYDYIHALNCYKTLYEVKQENEEFSDLPAVEEAKNVILRDTVGIQIRKTGKFDFSDIPFDNVCINCHGTGELYKLGRKSLEEDCKKCDPDKDGKPSGKRTVKCRNCKDGRFIKGSHEKGLLINVECKTCHGTGELQVKCRTCRGRKVFKKMVLSGEVESTTKCKYCHGKGFQTETEIKRSSPDNPIISRNLGDAIRSGDVPLELDGSLSQSERENKAADSSSTD